MTVHSRDPQTFTTLEPMAASHGPDCGAPPATHQNSSYEGAVYLCRDHVMTAINAAGYGLIYLTPPAMADWSQGESVIRWDMSTLRTSPRDWVDLWVMPFDDDLQLALDEWLPDGNGLPRRAVHIRMDNGNGGSIFRVELIENFQNVWAYEGNHPGIEQELQQRGLNTSASRRDTFELRLRQGHAVLTMPQYGITFADTAVSGLTWTRGVVTLGHHSYNPTKDCSPDASVGRTCLPDTWHWDNVSITPAIPFTILRADRRYADASHASPFVLAAPAPQNAVLRFTGIGNALQVSFDGGAMWQAPQVQPGSKPAPAGNEHFQSYRMAIPAGTTRVSVRGQPWFAGGYQIKDVSVWAPSASQEVPPSSTPTATSTITRTPTPPVPATPISTSTSTSESTSTSTPTATSSPTTTATPSSSTSTPTTVLATPTSSPLSQPVSTWTPTPTASVSTPTPTPTPPPLDVPCRLVERVLTCVLPS